MMYFCCAYNTYTQYTMSKTENVNFRTRSDWKRRLEQAALSRGLSVTAYITDRLENHIRADLSDLRKLLEEDKEPRAFA